MDARKNTQNPKKMQEDKQNKDKEEGKKEDVNGFESIPNPRKGSEPIQPNFHANEQLGDVDKALGLDNPDFDFDLSHLNN